MDAQSEKQLLDRIALGFLYTEFQAALFTNATLEARNNEEGVGTITRIIKRIQKLVGWELDWKTESEDIKIRSDYGSVTLGINYDELWIRIYLTSIDGRYDSYCFSTKEQIHEAVYLAAMFLGFGCWREPEHISTSIVPEFQQAIKVTGAPLTGKQTNSES